MNFDSSHKTQLNYDRSKIGTSQTLTLLYSISPSFPFSKLFDCHHLLLYILPLISFSIVSFMVYPLMSFPIIPFIFYPLISFLRLFPELFQFQFSFYCFSFRRMGSLKVFPVRKLRDNLKIRKTFNFLTTLTFSVAVDAAVAVAVFSNEESF
uniref:Transmembrane protein n=1 Tax=Cacopsylla melanoneura TaxID=428564 RepID=A0A8D8Z4Y1_9HEMI